MSEITIPTLSEPQKRMLLAANKRYGRITPGGIEAHYTHVGRGQGSTAKALNRLGLGGYTTDDGVRAAKFWIWETGHEVAEAILANETLAVRERVNAYLKLHPEAYPPEICKATGLNYREVLQAVKERRAEQPTFKIKIKTEFDSRASAEALAHILETDHKRIETEIVDVTPCAVSILHGPGHQSETYCSVTGPHETHGADIMGMWEEWEIDENGEEVEPS